MGTLFEFQKVGAEWLTGRRHALLADEMGLGKSAQVATAADRIRAKRILIICPAVARVNWQREFAEWSLFSPVFRRLETGSDRITENESAVCSFEYATRYGESLKGRFDLLVVDEVHFLKSAEAKRTKRIFGREGLIRQAGRAWVLSGTPAPNHAGELWVLAYTFGVTPLSYGAFIERYCDVVDHGYGAKIVGTKKARIPELRELLSKIMLRRLADQVLDLPAIYFQEYTVEPGIAELEEDPSFAQFLGPDGSLEKLRSELAREETVLKTALERSREEIAMLEGLAKSISTLRRYTGLQKVAPVAELVATELELGLYEKVVVFAIHRAVVRQLAKKLERFNPVVLDGATRDRQAAVDSFQGEKAVRVFIGNIQAAGTNITLTAAHHVIFAEQDFVPGNNAQAARRCRRIGQQKPVSVRFISLNNPMDEKVTRIVKRKTEELTEIFDSE